MVTKRWTRYGKDRLYVSLEDGTQVGWVDLLGGEERILLPEHTAEFRRTVAEVAPGRQMPSRNEPPPAVGPPADLQAGVAPEEPPRRTADEELTVSVPESSEKRPWVDLADRRPGGGCP